MSIARRMQDPLAELVKIDPKAIGVGQYQHDLKQNELTAAINEMRDELATDRFGKHYADLSEPQRKAVETAIPMAISEAEPTKIGGK